MTNSTSTTGKSNKSKTRTPARSELIAEKKASLQRAISLHHEETEARLNTYRGILQNISSVFEQANSGNRINTFESLPGLLATFLSKQAEKAIRSEEQYHAHIMESIALKLDRDAWKAFAHLQVGMCEIPETSQTDMARVCS